jgi:hypothetical protein
MRCNSRICRYVRYKGGYGGRGDEKGEYVCICDAERRYVEIDKEGQEDAS